MGVDGVGNPRCVRVFQATCGRVLCVHRRGTVHALFVGMSPSRVCDKNLPRRQHRATGKEMERATVGRRAPPGRCSCAMRAR